MVAILDQNANLIERVSCDATSGGGNARHHRAADLDGDGVVDSSDQLILQGNWGNYGVGDLNRDGVVDSSDLLILQANWGGALVAGELSQTDNIIGYAGYIFNAELVSAGSTGLYTVRHRHYAPDLGRWLSRDPIGYVDGMSLYEYVRGRPATVGDASGLLAGPDQPGPGIGPGLPSSVPDSESDDSDGPSDAPCPPSTEPDRPTRPDFFRRHRYRHSFPMGPGWASPFDDRPIDPSRTVPGKLYDHPSVQPQHKPVIPLLSEPPEMPDIFRDLPGRIRDWLPSPGRIPQHPSTVPTRGTPLETPRPPRKPSDGRPWPGSPAH